MHYQKALNDPTKSSGVRGQCRSDAIRSNGRSLNVRRFVSFPLVFVLAFFICICAHGQTNLSNITGTVTDSSGAAVANAKVQVINLATTAVRTAVTNSSGFYSVSLLPIGNYSVSASSAGFETSQSTIELTLNSVTANFSMKPGTITQSVTVKGASGSVALQTETHDVSVSMSPKQLVDLPNISGVSVLSIAVLGPASQPGSDDTNGGGGEAFYGQLGNAVNIAGLGNSHAQFLQDGVENVNLLTQTANIVSTVEASQGVTTIMNNSPARFGQPAEINVITRGGTNHWHGLAYEFLQNDAFDATNYFAITKPPLRYDLFGGDLGGPIIKNKLFGFFDYSGLRDHTDSVSENRVPTIQERAGNFAGDNVSPNGIYDPLTFNPVTGVDSQFPNNTIPANRFNAFGKLWIAQYPLPNYPLGAANINYITNLPTINDSDEEIGRVDWNMSGKNQLMGTFLKASSSNGTDTIVPGLFGIFIDTSGTNISLDDTYVLSQNLVNIGRFGLDIGTVLRNQQGVGAKNYDQYYGINNLIPAPAQWTPPTVGITDYTGLGDPYSPQGATQHRYQYADEIDWTTGHHTIAFGGQFVRTDFAGNWVVTNNGLYQFDGIATSKYTSGQPDVSSPGNGLADVILGYPLNATGANGTSLGTFIESDVAAYVQDDWKIRNNLTLNFGLRYDFYDPPVTAKSALFDVATNSPVPGTWNTNYNDWGPRVGFAWSTDSKTVVHGGFGIYYSPILYNNLQFELLYSPNFAQQSKTFSINNPVYIENEFGPSSTGTSGYSITKTLKDQSAQEWNLNIQRSLNDNTLFTLAYIGDVLRHESVRADANQPYALSPGNTTGILDVKPQPLAGPVLTQMNNQNANYNALAVSIQRQYANGLQFLASYTWSKAMDILDGESSEIQDIYDPGLQYSLASFNRTNNFLLSGIYDLPIGYGKRFANGNSLINREVVGGWQLSLIQQLASGQPVSIYANNDADTSYVHPVYALQVCNPNAGFRRTKFVFFNPACFAQPGVGHYGTARNVDGIRQPGLNPTDLSLFKIFPIVGDQQVQFRFDAFGLLNHPMFGSGDGSITSPNLGQLTYQASGLRSLQVSLKYMF